MRSMLIAHHLVLTGYGHWLPNDPRGSGSLDFAQDTFAELGPIHHGRKRVQPPRAELRAFYREAVPKLTHDPIWFDMPVRETIGLAFSNVARTRKYTVWACAVLRNHAHLVVRRHRDSYETIWWAFADASRELAVCAQGVARDHPFWSSRPYGVFLNTPIEVRDRIAYVEGNPQKERLPPQQWPFVVSYDNWPFHKK